MTICAGFRSTYGVILCTDSQETQRIMKFDVPKLIIRPNIANKKDKVRMIFAGAGDGPFIEKLVEEMWEAGQCGPDMSMQAIFGRVEEANIKWHKKIWEVYKAGDKPVAEILIAIYAPRHQVNLYKTYGPIVSPVEDYAFVGIGGELGEYLAKHVRITESMEDDVNAAIYIIENAKEYVDGCGGDTQIAALMCDGSIHKMAVGEVNSLAEGISQIASEVFYLFSCAANLDYPKGDLDKSARSVAREIHSIRSDLRKKVRKRIRVKPALEKSVELSWFKNDYSPTKD